MPLLDPAASRVPAGAQVSAISSVVVDSSAAGVQLSCLDQACKPRLVQATREVWETQASVSTADVPGSKSSLSRGASSSVTRLMRLQV